MTELLDRSEDPAKMIRMIILEMEETLVEVRASAARCIADGKEMRRALSRLEELQRSWTEKAELAHWLAAVAELERDNLPAAQRHLDAIGTNPLGGRERAVSVWLSRAELARRNIAGKLLRTGRLPATLWALNAYPYSGLSLFAKRRG